MHIITLLYNFSKNVKEESLSCTFNEKKTAETVAEWEEIFSSTRWRGKI